MLRAFASAILLLLFCALSAPPQDRTYKVGDRVEAFDVSWNKGAVTEIGTGKYQGYYMVKYDEFTTMRWFAPKDLRPGGPRDVPKTYPTYSIGDKVEAYDF